jgi:DNA-directed RNA polymerase specialized sigma subunit
MSNHYLDNKYLETNIIEFQKAKKLKKKYELLKEDIEFNKNNTEGNPTISLDENKIIENEKMLKQSQDNLAKEFFTLSENIVRFRNFQKIDYDDAVQEGVFICFSKIERFDPTRGSKAFNFLTTCLIHHLRQIYRSNKNFDELKKRYQEYYTAKMNREMPSRRI